MWNILSDFCLAFLLIIGLTEVIRYILFWFLKTKNPGCLYLVVSLHGHLDGAEVILRSAVERIKWCSAAKEKQVLCIDCGMDEETRKICMIMAEQLPVIRVCEPNDIPKIMEQ